MISRDPTKDYRVVLFGRFLNTETYLPVIFLLGLIFRAVFSGTSTTAHCIYIDIKELSKHFSK